MKSFYVKWHVEKYWTILEDIFIVIEKEARW